MAEVILSAFIQVLLVLLGRLLSSDLLKFARRGIREELDKWRKTMTIIQRVLDDAEEKQHTERSVKDWLDDLRDLFYDMEDLLDEFATEALHERKLMAGESQASASMVRNLIPSRFTVFTSMENLKFNIRLHSKTEKINKRFKDLVRQKDQLNLKENVSPRPSKRREIPPSTSVVTEDLIYGREEVAEAVLQLLISHKHSDALTKVPNVIPIVGKGGIGKTTLAQQVYKKVESFFDLKAWACVSEDFDVAKVTKTILQSMSKELDCADKNLDWLQVQLKKILLGKSFLVILDDVWNENYNDWTLLLAPFEVGAPRSSIIVTTRNQKVSSLIRKKEVQPFQLEELSSEACLSIFTQHALDARDFSAHPNLKDIGEELVRRCKGLPLAVKTVGGLLRSKQDYGEWEKVLNSKIWDIPEERSGIAPALMLSYHNLPSHLKRCFAYCSILSKDYEFEEKQVVLLWMAEGLIQPQQDDEEMEDLGSEYFHNLLSRSFFQQSHMNKSRFFMHDLINDLAQSVAADTCFRMEDRVRGSQHGNIPIKARHSSYLGSKYDVTKKFEVFSKFTSLRTFLPLMLPSCPGDCFLSHYVPFKLVPTLRCLRVLSFNGYCITELPDSIGELKHLRYLDLSETQIRLLPESITSLYNLQTLLLAYCLHLKKLPSMFRNLVNLRHLNIEGADSLEGMPMQIGKLTCLQTLSNLVLGKDSCSGIKELGPLKYLRGNLYISRLENVVEPKDAKDAELIKKTKISALSLEWSRDIDESRDRTSELEVLNGLRPHDALTKLVVINYGGTKFSNWLTSPSFPRMVSLRLENCYECTSLPPLGQYLLSLKNLWIKGMAKVKSVGSEFCGGNLETLHFYDMEEWENWSPCEEFPYLRELFLLKCPKLLGKLPNNLPLLNKVVINDCAQLVVSLSCFPDKCEFNIEKSEVLDMEGVVCGSKVTFKSIEFFRSLSPISEMEGLAELEELRINNCEELTTLWSDKVGSLPHLPFSHNLIIYNCPKLVSLVVEEVDQERLQPSLPKALMYNNTCLQSIVIYNCDSLTHFARSLLPPTLKRLDIWDCKNIRKLVDDDTNCSRSSTPSLLESLSILSCPSLECLTSSGVLPASLRDLNISKCPKLKSGAVSFNYNSYLESIVISDCENLKFVNEVDLLPPNLTSLRSLKIWNCQGIQSFPVEGFPTNLTTLAITNLKITDASLDWGLNKLTFLKELHIGGYQQKSFPEFMWPAFLTSLHISHCPNLELLDSLGFQKLGFLEELIISECKKLTSFPEDGLPCSLLTLDINSCQKLMSFPKNGLPPTLEKLRLMGCPLLEERCKKDRRGEWRRIADIPYVEISNKVIYDSEKEE